MLKGRRSQVALLFLAVNVVLIFLVISNFYSSYAAARDNALFLEWQSRIRNYEYVNDETEIILIRYEDIAEEVAIISYLVQESNLRQTEFRADEPLTVDNEIFEVRIHITKHGAISDVLQFFDALSERPVMVVEVTFEFESEINVKTELVLFAY